MTEEKMRVAFLSAASSVHTVRWVNALAARGHEVALFSLARHPAAPGSISPRAALYSLPGGYVRAAGGLKRALGRFAPQVLNAHYATGYGTLARLSGFSPVLLSVWGSDVYDFPRKGPVHRHIVTKNLRSAAAVASTSERMAARVHALCPELSAPFITPFGVDTFVFRPARQAGERPFTVGIVKALEPKYGVGVLLHAFARVRSHLPEARLEIYGGGSERAALERLAGRLGISAGVFFGGAVPHERVPEILNRFDVFCAPSVSDSESFGVAAVEALACGVPVAAGAVDGFKEVLREGQTGFLVPPGDAEALAACLLRLAGDAALRARMGRAGRADVQARFEWADCVTRMEDALRGAVERSRKEKGGVPA